MEEKEKKVIKKGVAKAPRASSNVLETEQQLLPSMPQPPASPVGKEVSWRDDFGVLFRKLRCFFKKKPDSLTKATTLEGFESSLNSLASLVVFLFFLAFILTACSFALSLTITKSLEGYLSERITKLEEVRNTTTPSKPVATLSTKPTESKGKPSTAVKPVLQVVPPSGQKFKSYLPSRKKNK